MARIEVRERTLYQFGELEDAAKEVARDWYRGCIEADEIGDNGDDFDSIATIFGIDFATRPVRLYGGGTRHESVIYWTLDPMGCAFGGSYSYAKGAPAKIRAYAPQDVELHRIADELQSLQRRNFYRLEAACQTGGRDGTYQEARIDRTDNVEPNAKDADALEGLLRDFAEWMGRQIEANRDYLYSDEAVDESILANGYEFTKTGKLA